MTAVRVLVVWLLAGLPIAALPAIVRAAGPGNPPDSRRTALHVLPTLTEEPR